MKTANKTKTIQVRLSPEDYEYLTQSAFVMGTNPSRLIRQLIQMSINAAKAAKQQRENKPILSNEEIQKEKEKFVNGESDVIVNANE